MNNTYIIGPSHLTTRYLNRNSVELFKNITIEGIWQLCNWSDHIHNQIDFYYKKDYKCFWMFSNYVLCNNDYLKLSNENILFLNKNKQYSGVSRQFDSEKHKTFLGQHSLKILDFMIDKYPNLKIIPWCLYTRHVHNKSHYTCKDISYEKVCETYKDNVIDIRKYVSEKDFKEQCTLDGSGHPTFKGYQILTTIIRDHQ